MSMKKFFRYTCSLIMLVFILISITGCSFFRIDYSYKYDEEWIIGKTIEEVTEKYGEFYRFGPGESLRDYPNSSMGLYLTKADNYKEAYNRYIAIYFDENGIARIVKKNYFIPGG